MKSAALTLLVAVATGGCARNKVLVINEPWSVERAEADCKSRATDGVPPCAGTPATEIRKFEAELSDAFRDDRACTGITLVTLNVPSDASLGASIGKWWLFLELSRGLDQQVRWTVSRDDKPDAHYSLTGNSEAEQAMHDACRFVHGAIGAP